MNHPRIQYKGYYLRKHDNGHYVVEDQDGRALHAGEFTTVQQCFNWINAQARDECDDTA